MNKRKKKERKKIASLYSHVQDNLPICLMWSSLLLGFNRSFFAVYLSAKRATTTNKNDPTTGTIGTPTDKSVTAKLAGTIAGISVALVAAIIMGIIYLRRGQANEIRRHTKHER